MPLSELLAQTTTMSTTSASASPFYLSDTDFAELLWENGQIVTHDHSSPPKLQTSLQVQATCATGISGNSNDHANANKGSDTEEFPANDILGSDDESMVPWIHYSLQDHHPLQLQLQSSPLPPVSTFHADFCSDFLEGFAGTNTSTFGFASTQETAASGAAAATSTSTERLSKGKGETAVTNFSLFKERLASGARASTSTRHVPEHTNASERLLNKSCADEKESSKIRHEPVLASSSVCSVIDEAIESAEPNHAGKRKIREGDESSSNSEEMDDESAGDKRVAIGRGSSAKKSRAAKVHNLSERRRRERINEKMKALQQLVPNCSKADKASMLEDAIEYLKTLQLQVQMMSMGNGMYMPPPVMMPPMMQPLRAPHMAHYPPLGMGMYQMSMYPQLHPPQFIQGPHAMHGMIPPMPLHSQVPVSASVSMRQTTVVSSSENATTAPTGVSVGSAFVRESAGAVSPAKPDPKAEML